jgi:hypothetical protein
MPVSARPNASSEYTELTVTSTSHPEELSASQAGHKGISNTLQT